jgi:hypothetical protein
MNKTNFIKTYNRLIDTIKEIIQDRVDNGTSYFRSEVFSGISNITKKLIVVDVGDEYLHDVWFEDITWKEIRKKRLNNFFKKFKIWQKNSK